MLSREKRDLLQPAKDSKDYKLGCQLPVASLWHQGMWRDSLHKKIGAQELRKLPGQETLEGEYPGGTEYIKHRIVFKVIAACIISCFIMSRGVSPLV